MLVKVSFAQWMSSCLCEMSLIPHPQQLSFRKYHLLVYWHFQENRCLFFSAMHSILLQTILEPVLQNWILGFILHIKDNFFPKPYFVVPLHLFWWLSVPDVTKSSSTVADGKRGRFRRQEIHSNIHKAGQEVPWGLLGGKLWQTTVIQVMCSPLS